MDYIINIENCNYQNVLSGISLKIEKDTITSVIGTKGCGKTTFLRLINKACDEINVSLINQNTLNNIYYNEMALLDVNLLIENDYLDQSKANIKILNIEQKVLIHIIKSIKNGCNLLLIDDLLMYLSRNNKEKILSYIKENAVSLVFVTTDEEEILLADNVIIIDDGKIKRVNKVKELINYEVEYKKMGFVLPFIKDLNAQLISYELIDEEYDNYESLIDEIWK